MRTLYFLFISIFLATAIGCSGLDVEQDGGDLTRGEVELLSKGMQQAIENKYPVLKHKLVNHYVDGLGQYVVAHNPEMPPLAYEFRVLKTNEIATFSLPGGIVYVTLGTLRAVKYEGEFVSALAHELAHQELGHPLVFWRRRLNAKRGQKYEINFTGDFTSTFLGPEGAFHYGEGMEKEADQLAPLLLYRAKIDPRTYISYLDILRKLQKSDPGRISSILMVHPPAEERIETAKAELLKLPPLKDPRLSTQSFDEIKEILKNAELKGKNSSKLKEEGM